MNLSNLSEIDKYLLNIGILVPITFAKKRGIATLNRVTFTSNVIFRVVFEMVWPKPRKFLPMQDTTDPLLLLIHTLQYINSATIVNTHVKNLHNPSEKAFQAAVFSVLNGLLPTSMTCLFEVKIQSHEALDLMLI